MYTRETAPSISSGYLQEHNELIKEDIIAILKADAHDETHALLAQALGQNHARFTSYSFYGIPLYTHHEWRNQYLDILLSVKPEHQKHALQPLLNTIQDYNLLRLMRMVKEEENKQLILDAFKNARSINLSVYEARELEDLFKLTQSVNQKIVAEALAANITAYNTWHFYGILKHCTKESKAIIIAALIKNFAKHYHEYDEYTLSLIKNEGSQDQVDLMETYTKPVYVPIFGTQFAVMPVT